MTLDFAMFIVDTLSCIAFIMTAYYAFVANRTTARINKQSADKDKKIMLFYQQSIANSRRERRIDDMVEYTQFMLTKWCDLTKSATTLLQKYKDIQTKINAKDFNFNTQTIDQDDVYFDNVNMTFWRCVLHCACRTDNITSNKKFELKVFDTIEEIRKHNIKFNAIIKLLLSNIGEFIGPGDFKGQLFQCFKETTDIYSTSHNINEIITSLYTNKLSRSNLMNILKYRIPSTRDEYDDELKRILGITSDITII